MALLYLVQRPQSRSPQLSPCHNRTQITLKSKQEYPGLVTFTFFSKFPYFKQWGWYFFSPRIRFGTCKVRRLNPAGLRKKVMLVWHPCDSPIYTVWTKEAQRSWLHGEITIKYENTIFIALSLKNFLWKKLLWQWWLFSASLFFVLY